MAPRGGFLQQLLQSRKVRRLGPVVIEPGRFGASDVRRLAPAGERDQPSGFGVRSCLFTATVNLTADSGVLPAIRVPRMARPLRLEFEGAIYHVTARGDRREPIFQEDSDRRMLLAIVGQAMERFNAVAFAYCLMDNHYHFVLRTRLPNLSRLMRHINGVYTQAYNRRHAQVGHVFQGRFKALLVDKDAYFLEVCRYVDLNPVRANRVAQPGDWAWSSYRAHTGQAPAFSWLDSSALHQQLCSKPDRGARRYARFVAAGRGVRLWDAGLSGQIYLGNHQFVQKMQKHAVALDDREIPKAQRRAMARPLSWYLAQHDRNSAIAKAYLEGGHTQSAIAAAVGLSVSRVSRLISLNEARGKT